MTYAPRKSKPRRRLISMNSKVSNQDFLYPGGQIAWKSSLSGGTFIPLFRLRPLRIEGWEKAGEKGRLVQWWNVQMCIVRIAYLLKKRIFAAVKPFTPPLRKADKGYNRPRRDGRVVDCGGLENRWTERFRGFESLSLRKQGCKSAGYAIYTLFYTQKLSFTVSIPKSFKQCRRASADTVVTVLTLRTKSWYISLLTLWESKYRVFL